MPTPPRSRSWFAPAGLGIAVGLVAMGLAAVYSMAATTEPERGQAPLHGGLIVLVGMVVGSLTGVLCQAFAERRGAESRR